MIYPLGSDTELEEAQNLLAPFFGVAGDAQAEWRKGNHDHHGMSAFHRHHRE